MNNRMFAIIAMVMTAIATTACDHPRVFVATGTIVGLEATPGDPNEGQTPAVTFGYRRAEVALVPISKDSDKVGQQNTDANPRSTKDAVSALATFNLAHNWFGPARIEQYIATGFAARDILKGEQYALALIGYERGTDELADKLADAYKTAHKDNATAEEMACWETVKAWMNTNFPGLPHTDILMKGFRKQRTKLAESSTVNTACKLTTTT